MPRSNPRQDPVRAPVQERSQKRVAQILEAAKQVIQEKGAAGMKMGDIAKTANISMGSIYQYFPNKRAIVAALASSYLEENSKQNELILETRPKSLVELSHITTQLLNQYYDHGRLDPVANDIWLGYATDKEIQDIDTDDTIRNRDSIFEASKHLFREDATDQVKRALLLIITFGGSAVSMAIQYDEAEGRRIMDEAIAMLYASWEVSILPLGRDA